MTREVRSALNVVTFLRLTLSYGDIGGWSEGEDSAVLPDWVDDSVATWIEKETALMNSVWGPPDQTRAALAFVHIPPYASSLRPPKLCLSNIVLRHVVQAVWENLNST